MDLIEVAAEFHQEEVLVWLHRDATVFEREHLGVSALERKLAGALMVASENVFHPWWSRTRGVLLKWRASSEMVLCRLQLVFRQMAVGGRPCRVRRRCCGDLEVNSGVARRCRTGCSAEGMWSSSNGRIGCHKHSLTRRSS
jgi:hypothetical protein